MSHLELHRPSGLELAIGVSAVLMAWSAFAFSKLSPTPQAVSVASVTGLYPVMVLAPCRWRGLLTEQDYLHEASRLVPGVGLYAIAAAIGLDRSDFPRTALVLGVASVYLAVAGRLPWRRVGPPRLFAWSIAAVAAVIGQLADLPRPLGWHTLTYGLFAISAYLTLLAACEGRPSQK